MNSLLKFRRNCSIPQLSDFVQQTRAINNRESVLRNWFRFVIAQRSYNQYTLFIYKVNAWTINFFRRWIHDGQQQERNKDQFSLHPRFSMLCPKLKSLLLILLNSTKPHLHWFHIIHFKQSILLRFFPIVNWFESCKHIFYGYKFVYSPSKI